MVSRIKQVILSVSIAVVFALFIGYGISAFYKSPEYQDFCGGIEVAKQFREEDCDAVGGKWTPRTYDCPEGTECVSGFCDATYECSRDYDSKREVYDRNVFVITLIVGLAAILIGGIFLAVESVGSGLMGGGVLTVIYGTIRYWGHAPDQIRFVILGLVLSVLVWLGYTKLNPESRLALRRIAAEKKPEKPKHPVEKRPTETIQRKKRKSPKKKR
ncbi:hypothetical protein JXB31_05490 [Candidatus Woesearchaeota archaeon]|nr:hypothetical protein [Candidatus Woesearchaeota archaeon]